MNRKTRFFVFKSQKIQICLAKSQENSCNPPNYALAIRKINPIEETVSSGITIYFYMILVEKKSDAFFANAICHFYSDIPN